MLFFRVFTHFWRILPYFHNRVMPFRSVIMQKQGGAVFRFRKQAPPLSLSGMRQTAEAGLSRPAVAAT